MAKENILHSEVLKQIEKIKETDILIGIPSYNNARTIGHVIRAVNAGLVKYFPDRRSLIVNSDGGSKDETTAIVHHTEIEDPRLIMLSHTPHPIHKIVTPYHGLPGKGSAFRTIFQIADNLNAKACAVVDSDLRSITPEWIELLLKPILLENFDYVAPFYLRHKYDGTITNSIIYPLTRGLYGKRIRQPIGGDFGFSGKLASHYLTKDVWGTDVARYGIDIWMTTTAIAEGYKVCQSFLGAKIHDAKDPGSDLSAMLNQVLGAVFNLAETYQHVWFSIRGSEPTPIFGFRFEVGLEPVNVNLDRMINAYKQGIADLGSVWKRFLPPDILESLKKLADGNGANFCFPDALWAKTVFEFVVAHYKNKMDRGHLIKSMTPLYLGRTASFVIETSNSTAADVENKIELLCLEYENLKPYLLDRWRN
ncbi:MAG: glycosyl transferase family 2 [Acidobacteria bacterium]|nr:MAG: glycosyl transferase family 2 [Acidobacteriota bacterium]